MEFDPDVDLAAYNAFVAEGDKLVMASNIKKAVQFYTKVRPAAIGRPLRCAASSPFRFSAIGY